MDRTYFANLPEQDIAGELNDRVSAYYLEIERNGRLALLQRVHRAYFSLDRGGRYDASVIGRAGEESELSTLRIAHYRNLLQHLHVLVTQQKPVFECRAINTDYKSQVQAILGPNILEYYMRERRHAQLYRQAAEYAVVYSEAYLEDTWDPNAGDPVAVDPDAAPGAGGLMNGDVIKRVYSPLHVVRQIWCANEDTLPWYIPWRWENRYTLAAKYPDKADDILNFGGSTIDKKFLYYTNMDMSAEADDDMLPVFTFWHERTPACPTGRRCVFLGPDCVLEYAGLDSYPEMPFYPMIPMRQHGTSFGYCVAFDLLCVQEAIDLLYSTVLSNQAAFGVQNIWMPPGSNITPNQLGGGLTIFESKDKPEPINLTQTPPEIFNFIDRLETKEEEISGINSVARGQQDGSAESGAALALIASQAVQFANGLQASYIQALEDGGMSTIRILQQHGNLPRTAIIAGKNNKSFTKTFTSRDIASISRVVVDVGNPVSRTVSGRITMAQDMLKGQLLKDPRDYIQVLETGSITPLIEDTETEKLLIQAENEALRDNKPLLVTAVDDHMQHIKSHRAVLSDPDARMQPELVKAVTEHIQEHIFQLQSVDPRLLNILGQQPLQPDAPMNQGANAPQPAAAPDAGEPDVAPPGQQVPAPPGAAPEVASMMPSMATPPAGAPVPPNANPSAA